MSKTLAEIQQLEQEFENKSFNQFHKDLLRILDFAAKHELQDRENGTDTGDLAEAIEACHYAVYDSAALINNPEARQRFVRNFVYCPFCDHKFNW